MSFIIIYTTHKNIKEAKKISTHLLEKRLIACVNFFPITSSFWWKGKIDTSKEIVTLFKTKKTYWREAKREIQKIHPYETPCIMKFSVDANEDYEQWIESETKK